MNEITQEDINQLDEERRQESSDDARKAEAYELYETETAGMEPKPDFTEWCEERQNDNDRFETEQDALRATRE